MKQWFRIFFKEYKVTEKMKASAAIEIEAINFSVVTTKAFKMGRKKGMRIAMIAEIIQPTGLPTSF